MVLMLLCYPMLTDAPLAEQLEIFLEFHELSSDAFSFMPILTFLGFIEAFLLKLFPVQGTCQYRKVMVILMQVLYFSLFHLSELNSPMLVILISAIHYTKQWVLFWNEVPVMYHLTLPAL